MCKGQAELFKALCAESRIRIIELLKQKGALGVNEMSEVLGISPSAVSQHLKVLRHAGLVRNERKGYWIPYEVDPIALEKCGELISRLCTCGCRAKGHIREAAPGSAEDGLALLKKHERELQRKLEEVQARIEETQEEA